ncbi:MAG: polymerase III, delta subunit protein [Candidatus Magasanikbacteria bacterium GW2011_GWA2_46_17]|uniref:DNA polymerase III subunit delta n=1 Tax=Candidatus Magasanikbacteria bacterium GW2011_GWA2_46_17 TaxID=1619042 RepID=A0A0G1NYW2_9BACT|nr:MAG: polymerase III, delta subunit protein [Candidatus Magasanikbacteria bacterium GW2011_GWA2_46_17]
MLIYIHGPNTFRSQGYLKQTIERFKCERDPQGYNVVRLDGVKDENGKILDALLAAPFLSPKRLIAIDNILSRQDTDLLATLTEYIKNKRLPEDNVIVFWQGEAAGKTKVAKELETLLQKEKWAMEFKPIPKAKLSAWVTQEIEKRGGKISSPAAEYLAEHAGDDMWHLNSLIDQLVAYQKKEIQLSDVQLFVEEKIDNNIFNMVDAIVAGNRKLAFKLLEDRRRKGENDGYLFAMILRQFRILIEMRDLYNRSEQATSDIMAKELGLHPFVARKSLPIMKKFSLDKLKESYNQLQDIDIKTKTGQGDLPLFLDVFVGKSGIII